MIATLEPVKPAPATTPLTIQRMLQQHLKAAMEANRPSGWISYQCHARLFTRVWGDKLAAELTRPEVEAWARERREKAAVATVRHEISFLKAAYNRAIDNGSLTIPNPVARLKISLKCPGRHQRITFQQELVMLDAYRKLYPDSGELLWTVERFAILTGLRQGEMAYLRPEHLQGDTLKTPDEGKTGSRLIPFHPEAQQIAALWCEVSAELGSPYVFFPNRFWPKQVGLTRQRLASSHTRRVWAPACMMTGFKLQRRDLRRTFGSRLVEKGVPLYEVQLLLGHASSVQTQTYCKVDLSKLRGSVLML